MIAEKLAEEILAKREARLIKESSVYPRNNPTASMIGECPREMVLSIIHWRLKPPFEPYVKARLEEGTRQENWVIQELIGLGYTITENNPPPFEIKDRKGRVILRGRIDGKIVVPGDPKPRAVPFEVKSMDKHVFNSIDSMDDFKKFFWTKKYVFQMQSYLYDNEEEEGLFILTDLAGHWKTIPIFLDLVEMERILQLCEYVVESVEKYRAKHGDEVITTETETLPQYIDDPSACRRCWAMGRCCAPPIDHKNGVFVSDNVEIETKLQRREEIKTFADEYEEIDKEVKEYFKGKALSLCGDFEVIGKEITVNHKAKEAKTTTQWRTTITHIKSEAKNGVENTV